MKKEETRARSQPCTDAKSARGEVVVAVASDELSALACVVAVKWLDHAAEPDWTTVEDLREDPQEIITVGIPVKETDEALILAASVSETLLPMSQWVVAETTMILKALIVWRLPLSAIASAVARSQAGTAERPTEPRAADQ